MRIIKTVDQCFKYAKAEYPERDSHFDPDMLAMKVQDDPHEKKTEKLTCVDNVCTMTLHGRTFDLILSEILVGDEEKATPESTKVFKQLSESFPSELCTVQDIKDYFQNCSDETERDNGSQSGISNNGIVIDQHIPRGLRIILLSTKAWNTMNFNQRKAALRHSLSEYDHNDIVKIYKYARFNGIKLTVDDASAE